MNTESYGRDFMHNSSIILLIVRVVTETQLLYYTYFIIHICMLKAGLSGPNENLISIAQQLCETPKKFRHNLNEFVCLIFDN